MPKHYSSNNSGGATLPKTGTMFTPLCRSKQYSTTMDAMANKTRTGHPHTAKHYRYESAMVDDTANLHGYSPE